MRMRGGAAAAGMALAATIVSACAAPSCPAVYLNPAVHIDASQWLETGQLTTVTVTGTVCQASQCVTATPTDKAKPGELLAPMTLPTGKATVRVRLRASDGRTLDQTASNDVTLARPFGSGCGGREEVDLLVTKAGALVPGQASKLTP